MGAAQGVEIVAEHSYENVVPRHLRDIADELDLEEPAWYVGRPPVEALIKASKNGNPAGRSASTAGNGAVAGDQPAESATPPSA
jgi:hypothetical protein